MNAFTNDRMASMETGIIVKGINNIFTVKTPEGLTRLCRIKGKQLESIKGEYNALAVGDRVLYSPVGEKEGMITERLERRNSFVRYNSKTQSNQTVVANVDLIICVCSVDSPPFRPRFVDRVLACTQGSEVMIVLNKCDFDITEDDYKRYKLYGKLGYRCMPVSAQTGESLDKLRKLIKGKTVAFVGQSGVGKSSLINILLGTDQRVGDINQKYNTGNHTTNHAIMLEGPDYTIIDTPGVREFVPPQDDPANIAHAFPEFTEPAERCQYTGCLHIDEPGCAVKALVESGKIDGDRYESYLRIVETMRSKDPIWKRPCTSEQ